MALPQLCSLVKNPRRPNMLTTYNSDQYSRPLTQCASEIITSYFGCIPRQWRVFENSLMTHPLMKNGPSQVDPKNISGSQSFWALGSTSDMTAANVGCTSTFTGERSITTHQSTHLQATSRAVITCIDGCFLKWWYPTTMGFPTKNDHFGVFWGYHHLRKHPYIGIYNTI